MYRYLKRVKASSVLDAIDEIVKKLIDLGFVDKDRLGEREFEVLRGLEDDKLISLSKKLAKDRDYPTPMADRVIPKR